MLSFLSPLRALRTVLSRTPCNRIHIVLHTLAPLKRMDPTHPARTDPQWESILEYIYCNKDLKSDRGVTRCFPVALVVPYRARYCNEMTTYIPEEKPLAQKKCAACSGEMELLQGNKLEDLLSQLPEWKLSADHKRISRTWQAKNFLEGLKFFERVGAVAEEEGHHPDLHLESYRNVRIEMIKVQARIFASIRLSSSDSTTRIDPQLESLRLDNDKPSFTLPLFRI
eukprot:g34611.t1